MRQRMRSHVVLCLVLALAACQDPLAAPPAGDPQAAISDAAHGDDGNPGFHWLAPMVPQPAAASLGTFAVGLRPAVRLVCFSTTDPGLDCDPETTLAEFGVGTGVVVHDADHYQLNLDTDQLALAVSTAEYQTVYRIAVLTDPLAELGGPFVLGFADVSLGSNGREARNLASDELIGLVDGRTLPVKFRIDRGAYEHELRTANATTPDEPAVPLCQTNCIVEVVQPTEQSEVSLTDQATEEEVTGVLFEAGDLATTSIVIIDELETDGPDENCAAGVTIDKHFCYRYEVFPKVDFGEPVRVGICPRDLPIGPGSYWRLFKVDYDESQRPIVTRPEMVDVSDFLPCQPSTGALGALRRAAGYAFDWLVTPLHAAVAEKIWGGMAGDFSDLFWAEDAEMTRVGSADTTTAPGSTLAPTVLIQAMNVGEPTVPLAGAIVTYEITAGTGWLTAPEGVTPTASDTTADGRTFRLSLPTDASGHATVQWTVGGGANALEAASTAAFMPGNQAISFTATALQPELDGLVVDANNYQLQLAPNYLGTGFFRGANVLFGANVAYGTDAGHVFFFDTRSNENLSFIQAGIATFVDFGGVADHHTAGIMVESSQQTYGPRTRLELVTLRETFAWASAADADYVIVRYTIVNPSSAQLDGLHLGFFADQDIGGVVDNQAHYDPALGAAVTSVAGQPLRSAFILLGHPVAHYRQWQNPGGAQPGDFIDPGSWAGWFDLLASTTDDAGVLGPRDGRDALTAGTVTLPGNGFETFAVALIGAENDADLARNVAAARARYASLAAPPVVHVVGLEVTAGDIGHSAVLTLPLDAASFVVEDARCGHAQLTLTGTEGAQHTVAFVDPIATADGRIYCSGRLADGSYFTNWDVIEFTPQ